VHFRCCLNVSRDGEEVMSEDKSFHMHQRQERRNVQHCSRKSLTEGTNRLSVVKDRSLCLLKLVTVAIRAVYYLIDSSFRLIRAKGFSADRIVTQYGIILSSLVYRSVSQSVMLCTVALRCRELTAHPMHFFRHFCFRIYRSAKTHCEQDS